MTFRMRGVVPGERGSKVRALLAASVALILTACGGGSDNSPVAGTAPPTPPVITAQPVSVTTTAGSSATFSVTATGSGLGYQWLRRAANGATFVDIPGASARTYTLTVDATMNGDQFRVFVQNAAGIAVSDPATLSITTTTSAPIITQQPADQVSVVPVDNDFDNRAATFSVAATGSPAPTFQWQVATDTLGLAFADVPGATSATFSPGSVTIADNGKRYRAIARNSVTAVSSTTATLRVVDVGIGGQGNGFALRPGGEIVAAVLQFPPVGPDFAGVRTTTATTVRTLAGHAGGPALDGTGAVARFGTPVAITLDAAGNAYVLDGAVSVLVRRVSPAGVVSTIAGNGVAGLFDGTGAQASFNAARALTMGVDGNVYVADYGNSAIRQVTPAGVVTTFAGGTAGAVDGVGRAAQFTHPYGIAADAAGNLFVTEGEPSCRLRRIARDATVTTLSNTGCGASVDGPLGTARFFQPTNLAFDGLGNLFVADSGSIRKISAAGDVTTARLFGMSEGVYTNGPIAADSAGNFYLLRVRNGSARYVERNSPAGQKTALPQVP